MKIAILTPTRERAKRRKIFHNSVISLASSSVKCYYYIDNNDPELEEYKTQTMLPGAYNIIGEPISVSKSWNILASKAIQEGADVLIMGNDDIIYETKDWDLLLKKEILNFPDNIYCLWFEDKINGDKHCAFPIVSKEWVKCLGYFTPGIFNFGYNDTWIFDIAKKIGRYKYLPNIIAEHKHWSINTDLIDNTCIRNRWGDRGNLYMLDAKIWEEQEYKRVEEANKLRELMI
jgi:hypothetical protein